MKFNYSHLLRLQGISDRDIVRYQNITGYGRLYHNLKLAQSYMNQEFMPQEVLHIGQCDYTNMDKAINNCFVIFESDYLPKTFIQTIKRQTGIVLVNSEWMKNVVLDQTDCDEHRILKIPYLQNYELLDKYKTIRVDKDQNIITFYTIADYKDVKNLLTLFDAFNSVFEGYKDVQLVIKTSNGQFLKKGFYSRKNGLPSITVINDIVTQVQLYKLHMLGDIYVSSAYCVGWQIPPFQAAYFGKPLICGNHSAFTQWVDFDVAVSLQSTKKAIPLRQYSDGRFSPKKGNGWMINYIQQTEIQKKLLYAYNNYKLLKQKRMNLERFSIKNINQWLK